LTRNWSFLYFKLQLLILGLSQLEIEIELFFSSTGFPLTVRFFIVIPPPHPKLSDQSSIITVHFLGLTAELNKKMDQDIRCGRCMREGEVYLRGVWGGYRFTLGTGWGICLTYVMDEKMNTNNKRCLIL